MNAAKGSHSSQSTNDSSEDLFSEDESDFIETLAMGDADKSEDQIAESPALFFATQPLFDSFSSEENASNSNSDDKQCVAQTFKSHPENADRERLSSERELTNHDKGQSSSDCSHRDFQNSTESQLHNKRLQPSATELGTILCLKELETNDEKLYRDNERKRPLADCSVVSDASLFSGDEDSDCEHDDRVSGQIDVEPPNGPPDAFLSVENVSTEGAASSHLMDPKKQKTSEKNFRTKRKVERRVLIF